MASIFDMIAETLGEWCRLGDSNTRPTDYKSVALPTELNRLKNIFYIKFLSVKTIKTIKTIKILMINFFFLKSFTFKV